MKNMSSEPGRRNTGETRNEKKTLVRQIRKQLFWIIYAIFVSCAVYFNENQDLFKLDGPFVLGKFFIWILYVSLLLYSIYCSQIENLFKSISKISELYWGIQIGIDLYIGFLLSLFFMYMIERNAWVVLIWMFPTIIFGNLSLLVYFCLNYDVIVKMF